MKIVLGPALLQILDLPLNAHLYAVYTISVMIC